MKLTIRAKSVKVFVGIKPVDIISIELNEKPAFPDMDYAPFLTMEVKGEPASNMSRMFLELIQK